MNMTVSDPDIVNEEIQQLTFLIKNDNNNFSSSSMLLTTYSSIFSNSIHELQLHNSNHFNHNFQEFNSSQTHHVLETNSNNIKSDLCIMNINGVT
jgi:hypothetical protein